MTDLTQKAMLVRLNIRTFTNSRKDDAVTEEIHNAKGAQWSAGLYSKKLIDPAELADITRLCSDARRYHYENTLAWEDAGVRILPAANYFDYTSKMATFKQRFDSAVASFVAKYPSIQAQQSSRLGAMYDPSEYPQPLAVQGEFNFEVAVTPMPSAADFRVSLGRDEEARIRGEIEARTQQAMQESVQELWLRLHEAVSHMQERLSDPSNTFHKSMIANLRSLVSVLPRLNFTGDEKLIEMTKEVESKLTLYSTEEVKGDPALRQTLAESAEDILSRMSGYTN